MEQKTIGLLIVALLVGGIGGYVIADNQDYDMMAGDHMMSDGTMMDNMSGEMQQEMSEMSMADMMNVMNDELGTKTGEEFEIAFLEGMIEHHVGAVDMAELVLKNTERPELVKLANEIIEAQKGEIELMREWRATWYN